MAFLAILLLVLSCVSYTFLGLRTLQAFLRTSNHFVHSWISRQFQDVGIHFVHVWVPPIGVVLWRPCSGYVVARHSRAEADVVLHLFMMYYLVFAYPLPSSLMLVDNALVYKITIWLRIYFYIPFCRVSQSASSGARRWRERDAVKWCWVLG